ncbi:malate/L-sulfolactate dehydrogenase [Salinisphaera dokdonensis CL-ES53]|uniref:Malate/L-sulfolactate dehydrogenase n=1 Tax=Salinisphaera dokdonensis CL-ES53 TaxID=1304272 RepID=A0ABV2B0Z7_9GAMM
MAETRDITLDELASLAYAVLRHNGFGADHTRAIAETVLAAEHDACHSHGIYRLIGIAQACRDGVADGGVAPTVVDHAAAVVKVDAGGGFSPLAFERGLPMLIDKARRGGIAAMAINRCFHLTALWPEVERLAAENLVGLAMTPSHAWVAPFGGKRGLFGTNPLAFAWPRPNNDPYVFDFATSAIARGDIELHAREDRALQPGWALDRTGAPTIDAHAALEGAMLPFGGHKGSALATLIELLAGPLIGDLTSGQSQQFDAGRGAAPFHGELIIAIDPAAFAPDTKDQSAAAERLFEGIVDQGARLPSQRRRAARRQTKADGFVRVNAALVDELNQLID